MTLDSLFTDSDPVPTEEENSWVTLRFSADLKQEAAVKQCYSFCLRLENGSVLGVLGSALGSSRMHPVFSMPP